MDRLKEEFDALGFICRRIPLDSYASQLSRLRIVTHAALGEMLKLAGTATD